MKAEEKKINLFYLKDMLIKDNATQEDKLDALFKIKRNLESPVFGLAMKSLLSDFDKIKDSFIEKELLQSMASSSQHALLE